MWDSRLVHAEKLLSPLTKKLLDNEPPLYLICAAKENGLFPRT
jgi:hypothetical protein